MDRNTNFSTAPIASCTQTAPHTHGIEELQQLRIALLRDGIPGRQDFTCPMIRAWRRQFDDTYGVDATVTPTDGSQTDETKTHGSRVREADIQVSNILLRWHCDGWPVATPRTEGETDLNGRAHQPAPTPAPSDPNCFGYAHRIPAATLPPRRKSNHIEGDQPDSNRSLAEQRNVDTCATGASTLSLREYLPGVGQRVALDATLLHAADIPTDSSESNYEPGWYDKQPSTAFRHAPWGSS
ncbi:hypothetical protein [Curtobacterium sp. MCLR17_034]|uniref:hypothetical protein n=1 Tax=Curtobacterium sp. MCLR17_034 TaxID=2175623 RepID=UPI0015E8916E|nr:hypothetical protein [Curtobacterium sp. MCLR17_034]